MADENVSDSKGAESGSTARELTPARIVQELDRYIIAQDQAKRAVAIALRNRWRRLRVSAEMRDEIIPKNILMIGPTGVGKTEISRRLAKLAGAPFVKVEASKFTEVGYVGRDVESIVRDLIEAAIALVREEERVRVRARAGEVVEERLLDLLLPHLVPPQEPSGEPRGERTVFLQDASGVGYPQNVPNESGQPRNPTRERLRQRLRAGDLEDRIVELEVARAAASPSSVQILGGQGFSDMEGQLKEIFSSLAPRQKERKKLSIAEAREAIRSEAEEQLLDPEQISRLARERAEQTGIVFIDEVDKICGRDQPSGGRGPDVSREGVQRDLLPLVEGSTVSTKHGPVRTDHVLFIASGAFHVSKPSDLMPEFQGRFPIRVELKSLTPNDFERILTEPQNALTRQYQCLLETERVTLDFRPDAIRELATLTAELNSRMENIGARRLHTVLEKLLEDVLFAAEEYAGTTVVIDRDFVRARLKDIAEDPDLARYIL